MIIWRLSTLFMFFLWPATIFSPELIMLRMSSSDHFLSVVCPSVNIFKCLFIWSRWANFIGSFFRLGKWKIAKMVAVCYTIKTFKDLLLQNRGCLGVKSLLKSSGIWGLPKLLKWWSYIDLWCFKARWSLLPCAFVWAPYICIGKMLRISNNFSSEASWPPWGRGMKDY